jgi:hypothetical protein
VRVGVPIEPETSSSKAPSVPIAHPSSTKRAFNRSPRNGYDARYSETKNSETEYSTTVSERSGSDARPFCAGLRIMSKHYLVKQA